MMEPSPNGDRIALLCLIDLPQQTRVLLERDFDLRRPDAGELARPCLPAEFTDCRAIVTGYGGRVEAGLLDKLPALELIACFTAGRDMVDSAAAFERGISVWSNGAALAESVADLALALMLALARNVCGADRHVRSGDWKHARFTTGALLAGSRIGIAGYGAIGRGVAQRAKGFGMEVGCFSRSAPEEDGLQKFADIGSLADWADWLVLALPGTAETNRLVDADVLARLGQGGRIVNVARGSVVDETALVNALQKGEIAGAALDVFAEEPAPNEAFLVMENVVLSPHQGSNTREALIQRSDVYARTLRAHFGRPVSPMVTRR